MEYPSSNRQDKRDSKKKQDSKSVYTSKHIRIATALAEKSYISSKSQSNKK